MRSRLPVPLQLPHRLSRRAFLRSAALGASGLLGAYFLGCGEEEVAQVGPAPTFTAPPGLPIRGTPVPQALRWRQIAPSGALPPARRDHSLVSDGERLVLFGGRGESVLGDLWSYDLDGKRRPQPPAWTELTIQGGPSARFGHNATWDEQRARMILFGGQAADGSFFNDTWSFDPAAGVWARLAEGGTAPAARYGAAAALDPEGRLLITHGFTDTGRFDDTWQLDLASQTWLDVSPEGERPVERCLMRAVWDPAQQRLFIFGGQTTETPFLGDLWSFTGGRWRELPRQPAPPPRNFYAMVYDEQSPFIIVFGGRTEGGPMNDLWFFNAAEEYWTQAFAADAPSPRFGHDSVWLPENRTLLVFGGNDGSSDLNDLWELNVTAS